MDRSQPLAERMRPIEVGDFVGQKHLLLPGKPLYEAIKSGRLHSMIFWGGPGTGKTTLARMIARHSDALFIPLSAVLAGVKDIRSAVNEAQQLLRSENRRTILFVDEVHRFNKSQQDAFLPHVEDGTIFFIGATTENPSFSLNNALLSRAHVYVLNALTEEDLISVIRQALDHQGKGFGGRFSIDEIVIQQFAQAADGDARRALNLLAIATEIAESQEVSVINAEIAQEVLSSDVRRFDNQGEEFYNQISALHKAVRGSAPDAALYWLCRMLDGGCDPSYLARRIVRIASEDIGNADPRALQLAMNAWDAQQRLGSPEGELVLAQAVIYMACAAKSNAVYVAYKAAMQAAKNSGSLAVPLHLRNAPSKLMDSIGYGKGYRYAHNEPEGYAAGENYFPEELLGSSFYTPVSRGLEIKINEKLNNLKILDRQALKKSK